MKKFLLAFTLVLLSVSAHASFEGSTVQATYYFPDLNSVYDQQQAVVGPDVEFTNFPSQGQYTNVDFSAENILITYNSAATWVTAAFNGEFFGALSEITPISGVVINDATNMVGLTSDRIEWTSTSVSINWNGLSFDASTVVSLDVDFAEQGTAHFAVNKTFSDNSEGEVEVTLTCNAGTPLTQSFTISPTLGVTFTVSNLPDTGADCTVTESMGADGYTPSYENGSGPSETNCAYSGVSGGAYTCDITNSLSTFSFEVEYEMDDTTADVDGSAVAYNLVCGPLYDGYSYTEAGSFAIQGDDGESDVFDFGQPAYEPSDEDDDVRTVCMVKDISSSNSTVDVAGCEAQSFEFGETEGTCTLTASVFFEGIPTLSQYGMALLALLMLGVGFVGMRRIV